PALRFARECSSGAKGCPPASSRVAFSSSWVLSWPPRRSGSPPSRPPRMAGLLHESSRFRTKGVPMPEYKLPDLQYDYGALEPHISGRIMELHHDKHHGGYVKGANTTLEQLEEARDK